MMKKSEVLQQAGWFVVLLSVVVAALLLSWFLWANWDYGFEFWYDFYAIESHIDRYGPQNRYILGLDAVSPAEHMRLFSEISYAVSHHGAGLADISFEYQGKQQQLLRAPEIVHLEDVAHLIDNLRVLLYVSSMIVIAGSAWLLFLKVQTEWQIQSIILAGVALSIAVWLWLVGPKEVFYQIHIWVFPPDHDWFFYYQDSLMSTLMKAPYLFGGIATIIALAGSVVMSMYVFLLNRLSTQNKR